MASGVGESGVRQEWEYASSPLLVRNLRNAAFWGGLFLTLVGAAHLAAWFGGDYSWRGFLSFTMKTNAALGLLLSGICVALLTLRPNAPRPLRLFVQVCGWLTVVLGSLTLVENYSGWNFGIDEILAREPPGAIGVDSPNRMGTPASLGLALAGLSLLLLVRRSPRALRTAQRSALVIAAIGLLGTVGFLYNVQPLHTLTRLTAISWPMAVSLVILGLALISVRPAEGIMAALTADDFGGRAIRSLLPWCVGLPLFIGYLLLMGERRGIYDYAMDTALLILLFVCVFSSLVYFHGARMSRREAEERRTAEALRESEERYRSLFTNIIEGFAMGEIIFDERNVPCDFRLLEANEAFERETGLRRDAVLGRRITEVLPNVEREWIENYSRVALSGESLRFEHHNRDTDRYYAVFCYSPVPGRFAVVFRDETERRRAEEALRRSEVRLRATFDNAGVGIAEVGEGDRFVAVNHLACKILGRSADELLALNVHEVTWPEDRELSDRVNRELHEGVSDRFDYEKRYIRGDGSIVWAHVTAAAIRDAEGRWLRSITTIEDITDRKRTEEQLEAAKASAEQANQAKDHFLAVLSHELRTPLTPVLMGVSVLQNRRDLEPQIQDTLEMVRQNVEMESRLIDDLLDVTRIARGKVELKRKSVDLGKIIERAVDVCRPDIEARRLHFGVDLGPKPPYFVEADASRLQQVFWNLLKNAIKFTPNGGCVGVRCRPNRNHVLVEVNDSGIGIEPEALTRIFNAFEQAERSITRRFGGLGLGLAISKALVEMHGGEIQAHSAGRNKGSTFSIRLPMSAPEGAAVSPRQPHPEPVQPMSILLVEDHGATARMLRFVLAEKGHQVELAADVETALGLAEQRRFDLLLSDLGLPDGSGHDLIRSLRARGHSFPAIALSGYGQEDDIRMSREAGFAVHLTKPASPESMEWAIRTAVAGSES